MESKFLSSSDIGSLYISLAREASNSLYEIKDVKWLWLSLIPFHSLSVRNNPVRDADGVIVKVMINQVC
jgi:hypothetical protein